MQRPSTIQEAKAELNRLEKELQADGLVFEVRAGLRGGFRVWKAHWNEGQLKDSHLSLEKLAESRKSDGCKKKLDLYLEVLEAYLSLGRNTETDLLAYRSKLELVKETRPVFDVFKTDNVATIDDGREASY
jgi:hypothetical protein